MSAVIRPPREVDVPEVARLMGQHWPEPVDEDSVRRSWTSPGVELQNDVRLDDQSYLWFLALAGDEPAGFALCHPHSGNDELGWVRILGVRRPWRRRGLGRALLLHAFSELRQRGFRLAGLGVDAESLTGANRLYEQVGMRVSARFDIYEKTVA